MSRRTAKAKICWVPPEAGGRTSIPSGPTYSTVARFDRLRSAWPSEAWSIVAEFFGPPDDARCSIARIRLLSEEGPDDLLKSGERFDLFEGAKLVARGQIVGEEDLVETTER
jgi:hypothetical protein